MLIYKILCSFGQDFHAQEQEFLSNAQYFTAVQAQAFLRVIMHYRIKNHNFKYLFG